MSSETYGLNVSLSAFGVAVIDAEKAAMEMLREQFDIDDEWQVGLNAEAETVTSLGQVLLWRVDLYASRRRRFSDLGNVKSVAAADGGTDQ